MNINVLILIILLLILLLFTSSSESFEILELSSTGKEYTVQEYDNTKEAANILAKLDKNIHIFIRKLKQDYPNDDRIKRMEKNLSTSIIEEAPHVDNESTYTINKGELIKICIRKKIKNKPFHNLNMLMFVVIHELAHVISISIGHTDEFMVNFRFLLKNAAEYNINYEPVDFSKNNVNYCGVEVTHNPYYNHI